jgi:S1-C subfamily serine protease
VAAAISEDGYFLTSFHSVARQPAWLLSHSVGGDNFFEVSVVWSNADSDVALIRADIELDAWFESVADPQSVAMETVFALGFPAQVAAGELGSLPDLLGADERDLLEVECNMPVNAGFSGGAVIVDDGRLVGVLSGIEMEETESQPWISSVNPRLLQRLIDEDRVARMQVGHPVSGGGRIVVE